MGAAYETLRAEKVQFAGELDAAMVALAGMKDVLAEREKSLEEAREANKALTAEVDKMEDREHMRSVPYASVIASIKYAVYQTYCIP